MTFDAAELAKTARILDESDRPNSDPELRNCRDPDDARISTSLSSPQSRGTLLPNPLSPVKEMRYFRLSYSGAKFQSHDGSQWMIEDYPWQGMVQITNVCTAD